MKDGTTPLHIAMLQALTTKQNPNEDPKAYHLQNPNMLALLLLSPKVDPNVISQTWNTPLQMAVVQHCDLCVAMLLRSHRLRLDIPDGHDAQNHVNMAIKQQEVLILLLLIKSGELSRYPLLNQLVAQSKGDDIYNNLIPSALAVGYNAYHCTTGSCSQQRTKVEEDIAMADKLLAAWYHILHTQKNSVPGSSPTHDEDERPLVIDEEAMDTH